MTDYRSEEYDTDRIADALRRDEARAVEACQKVSQDVEAIGDDNTPRES